MVSTQITYKKPNKNRIQILKNFYIKINFYSNIFKNNEYYNIIKDNQGGIKTMSFIKYNFSEEDCKIYKGIKYYKVEDYYIIINGDIRYKRYNLKDVKSCINQILKDIQRVYIISSVYKTKEKSEKKLISKSVTKSIKQHIILI